MRLGAINMMSRVDRTAVRFLHKMDRSTADRARSALARSHCVRDAKRFARNGTPGLPSTQDDGQAPTAPPQDEEAVSLKMRARLSQRWTASTVAASNRAPALAAGKLGWLSTLVTS
jgi:hypothetical protein